MPKGRHLKVETWTDDKFVTLSPPARLLFMGMWNYACDNGHVEDNAVQLKMRLMPMDNVDIQSLIDEMLATGQLERGDGYLKVVKLPEHQRIDLRFLLLCEWCEHDEHTVFTPSDKRGRTPSAQRAPAEQTTGARRVHVDDVDVDVDGEEEVRDDVARLCSHLADRIEGNGSKRPTVTKAWQTSARLLMDKDGRDEAAVHKAIDWCQDSDFWRPNIMSMTKLREKYDQLRLQAAKTEGGTVHRFPGAPVEDNSWMARRP